MTTQGRWQDLEGELDVARTPGIAADQGALTALFESSPAVGVRTSAPAEIAFLAGLVAAFTAPFTLTMALSAGIAVLGLMTSVVGLARASRPAMAGGLLVSVGLVLSLAALALVGLRYAGIDTAVGDPLLPTLADWLNALNGLLPTR